MKTYHYLTLSFLVFALTLAACKKSDEKKSESGDYYIKFKLDGVDKILTKAHGGLSNTSSVCSGGLYGSFAADTSKESTILLLDSLPFNTSKTYKCVLVKANGKNDVPQALFSYYDEHNALYVATYLGYVTGPHLDLAINVKFSEITTKYLKGTFDAAIVLSPSHQNYPLHQVTNGEFFIKRDF